MSVQSVVSVPCVQRKLNAANDEPPNHDGAFRREKSAEDFSCSKDSSSSEDDQLTDDDSQFSGSSQFSTGESLHSGKKDCPTMKSPDQQLKNAEKKADRFLAQGESDKAINELTRAMALTRIVYGDQHWKLAASYVHLAEAYMEHKEYYAQAEYHAERARAMMSSIGSNFQESEREKVQLYSILLKMHHIIGVSNTAMKKYLASEKDLNRAQRLLDELSELPSYSDVDRDLWKIKLNLASARLSEKQKKFSDAIEKYKEAVELTKSIHGKESVHLIPVYKEWAKLEQSKGKNTNHERAIDLLQRAHSVATANYKDGDEELINTALMLARAYSMTRKEEAAVSAESYMNECLVSCTNTYGPEHPKTLSVQDELARILIQTNRHREALKLLRSTMNVKCSVYGDYSAPVADTLTLMAAVHLADSDLERALKAYQKCFDIHSLMLGEKHKKTLDIQRNIDILRANPALAGKQSKKDELKSRPRFSNYASK